MDRRTGVVLINLGTPEGTGFAPMRRYLRQFLSDKRVIDRSGLMWWLILNGIILTRRPAKSGRAYAQIWNRERDESPLKTTTRSQAEQLDARLRPLGVRVDWAMRYGQPSIGAAIERLGDRGCTRLLLAPLYPQYAGATTGTALDAAFDALARLAHPPALRTLPPYYDAPAHVAALAETLRRHLDGLGWRPDAVLLSYHGLPEAVIAAGDPYRAQCEATTRALRAALPDDMPALIQCYQSRPSRGRWIGPHLEEELARLAGEGARSVAVMTPGFAADCVETLEEVAIRGRQEFLRCGGKNFTLVPCLNDAPASIAMLETLLLENLSGWL